MDTGRSSAKAGNGRQINRLTKLSQTLKRADRLIAGV